MQTKISIKKKIKIKLIKRRFYTETRAAIIQIHAKKVDVKV